jgi:hypothetical protein
MCKAEDSPKALFNSRQLIPQTDAADVLNRNRQLIIVVRETVTSYTSACFIQDEKRETLRDELIRVLVHLKPLNGPSVVVRVDPAPGFRLK